jgi:hypothetical protein
LLAGGEFPFVITPPSPLRIENSHLGHNVVTHPDATRDRFGILIDDTRLISGGLWRVRSFQFKVTPMIQFGEVNLVEI